MAAGAAATRGGWTLRHGALARPTRSNSSTSGGKTAELWFICLQRSELTTLTTNSPVASMLVSECLRGVEENITKGGLPDTALKNEYGARFAMPSADTVEIQPIGRGEFSWQC